jgi:3-oxoacyl-[acyl-carrier-protein] synthase-3
MTIGIKQIGTHIASQRIDNLKRADKFGVDTGFIEKKIGIRQVARMGTDENTLSMCLAAMQDLENGLEDFDRDKIGFVCVCTENPDISIPFTAALLHDALGLNENCAAFDINLGCSGYAYSLEIARTFMESNRIRNGLVFTADPYSRILDSNDKNTELLFGDGATVTFLSDDPVFIFGKGFFKTIGHMHGALTKSYNVPLFMDGRGIFNFVMRDVPKAIRACLNLNGLDQNDVDIWLLHQASRFMVQSLAKSMQIPLENVPFEIGTYGNTVSSSIPFVLQKRIADSNVNVMCMSGFGVGLSISTHIIKRK